MSGRPPPLDAPSGSGAMLDASQRAALLALVRATASALARGEPPGPLGPAPPGLERHAACFVTLHVGGQLRGCIGTMAAGGPLWQAVRSMAIAAATRDPRFPPLDAAELAELACEISVLTPLRPIRAQDVVVGRHGLEIERDGYRGLLLPQVAVEHHLDREAFLGETCRKAGLPRDAWRAPGTVIRAFEAEVFAET